MDRSSLEPEDITAQLLAQFVEEDQPSPPPTELSDFEMVSRGLSPGPCSPTMDSGSVSVTDFGSVERRSAETPHGPPTDTQSRSSSPVESVPMLDVPPIPRPHHLYWYQRGDLTVVVDDIEFRITSYYFDRDSSWFKERLELTNRILLDNVSVVEFERLLHILFPKSFTEDDLNTVDEWSSVLKLATRWTMKSLRQRSIHRLSAIATPVDKIVLARDYNVPNWLLAAHCDMAKRDHGPTDEEIARLCPRDYIGIFRSRARLRDSNIVRGLASHDMEEAVKREVDVSVKHLDLDGVRVLHSIPVKSESSPTGVSAIVDISVPANQWPVDIPPTPYEAPREAPLEDLTAQLLAQLEADTPLDSERVESPKEQYYDKDFPVEESSSCGKKLKKKKR